MTFIITAALIVAAIACAFGLWTSRPWLVAAVMVLLSSAWLLVRTPIGPIGLGMFVLCAVSSLGGALVAFVIVEVRAVRR